MPAPAIADGGLFIRVATCAATIAAAAVAVAAAAPARVATIATRRDVPPTAKVGVALAVNITLALALTDTPTCRPCAAHAMRVNMRGTRSAVGAIPIVAVATPPALVAARSVASVPFAATVRRRSARRSVAAVTIAATATVAVPTTVSLGIVASGIAGRGERVVGCASRGAGPDVVTAVPPTVTPMVPIATATIPTSRPIYGLPRHAARTVVPAIGVGVLAAHMLVVAAPRTWATGAVARALRGARAFEEHRVACSPLLPAPAIVGASARAAIAPTPVGVARAPPAGRRLRRYHRAPLWRVVGGRGRRTAYLGCLPLEHSGRPPRHRAGGGAGRLRRVASGAVAVATPPAGARASAVAGRVPSHAHRSAPAQRAARVVVIRRARPAAAPATSAAGAAAWVRTQAAPTVAANRATATAAGVRPRARQTARAVERRSIAVRVALAVTPAAVPPPPVRATATQR